MKKQVRAKKSGSIKPSREKNVQRKSRGTGITCRQRFLNACHCKAVDCTPIWLMRQAGRALPEYRALKEQYSFLQLVQTPELAAEVTLQPIRRFGFDAAILFSDILVIPEALGQRYHFKDSGGIEMEFVLKNSADVDRLQVSAVRDELDYVAKALPMIKNALNGERALIGFAGSPWTLANFMVDGAGVKEYVKTKGLMYSDPKLFERLMDKLTRAVTEFLQLQIDAGADAVQIFDSLGGVLSDGNYEYGSARWIRQIVRSLRNQVPVIVFGKGVHGNWTELAKTKAQILGVDWNVALADVRGSLPAKVGVQGNMDPFLLCTTPEVVAKEARRILASMRGRKGHIFNLGHGVPPGSKIECIEALISAVRSFK